MSDRLTLAPAAEESSPSLNLFERLARDPNASVEKIERLMALWERGEARKAEQAFHAAMSAAQTEMKPVIVDSTNPQTHSRYASYEAMDAVLRPIYTKHGLALSFNTGDVPQPEYVRVLCDVTHFGGHSKAYHLDLPADGKGAKGGDVMTKTHAAGSAISYGMRYLLKMIFNVAIGEEDDDGNKAGAAPQPDPPEGYDDWVTNLVPLAEKGETALRQAWNLAPKEYRAYLTKFNMVGWQALKQKAARIKS